MDSEKILSNIIEHVDDGLTYGALLRTSKLCSKLTNAAHPGADRIFANDFATILKLCSGLDIAVMPIDIDWLDSSAAKEIPTAFDLDRPNMADPSQPWD